jgi:PhnB protein
LSVTVTFAATSAAVWPGTAVILTLEASARTALPVSPASAATSEDAVYRTAMAAEAKSMREPVDRFYGDRGGGMRDLEGNEW